jgi:RecJ-like exonuclease
MICPKCNSKLKIVYGKKVCPLCSQIPTYRKVWKINPKTKIKESKKFYNRQKEKLTILKENE